jgi:hypothetical protein
MEIRCDIFEKWESFFHKDGHVLPTLPDAAKLLPGRYYVQYLRNGDLYIINRIVLKELDEKLEKRDYEEGTKCMMNAQFAYIMPNLYPYKFVYKRM